MTLSDFSVIPPDVRSISSSRASESAMPFTSLIIFKSSAYSQRVLTYLIEKVSGSKI